MLKLHNTLTKSKETFIPLSKKVVGIYSCGPTVYGQQHAGNLRSAVLWDLLRRVLLINGYHVNHVVNITDFGHLTSDADEGEDKILKGLKREGLPVTMDAMRTLANQYAEVYFNDRKTLNILPATHFPFASDHINEQIDIIKKLQEKGFAYTTSDGVYFDTNKDSHYGRFHQNFQHEESRIGENTEKKDPRDFALWKFNDELGWESPWGHGFPGWHIECSAMSMKYLGESFDIHTGGIEHIDIHHENECAQSENATGKTFANYWLHNDHLLMNSEKIAKSVGNTVYLPDIIERGYNPLALRYLFLQAHYRSSQNFTWESLDASQKALYRLYKKSAELFKTSSWCARLFAKNNGEYFTRFLTAINNDLDLPQALAITWEMLKDSEITDLVKLKTLLTFDEVLGLGVKSQIKKCKQNSNNKNQEIPDVVTQLLSQRKEARENKNWSESDRLRAEITKLGFMVKDTSDGQVLEKIS